ncbi:MAG: DUF116 domain-containing protein [Firmicutes bacterium]|nr:DUF116 domain-containing protein [Bacillota bacterium]
MTKKRLFLGLLACSLLLMAGILAYFLLTFFRRDPGLLRYIFLGIVLAILVMLSVILLGFSGIILSLLADREFHFLEKPINFTVSLLYPVVIRVGRLFKIAQDKIQRSFVEVNNQLVRIRYGKLKTDRLLVLLPHCLQTTECTRRVAGNQSNCARCGRCPVGSILDLCDRYGVPVRIATGGTLARDAVRKLQPQAIVAVACERDLTSGILDCIPLPVLGVTNDRPNGPCHNTTVNLQSVEESILFFLKGGEKECTA